MGGAMGPKSVTLPTRGQNLPLRCLDFCYLQNVPVFVLYRNWKKISMVSRGPQCLPALVRAPTATSRTPIVPFLLPSTSPSSYLV